MLRGTYYLMTEFYELKPASGDYPSAKAAKEAFLSGRNFQCGGKHTGVRDIPAGTVVVLRYKGERLFVTCKVPKR